jgi:parvulin-like peptidyl-prolyl isomerase
MLSKLNTVIFCLYFFVASLPVLGIEKKVSDGQFGFLPDVLAEINQQKITRESMIKVLRQKFSDDELSQFSPAQIKSCLREIISENIDRLIISKILATEGIVPSPEMVIAEFRKNFNKLSSAQQVIAMKQFSKKAITLSEYEEKISNDPHEQFRIATLKWAETKFAPDINITDGQVEDYYRQNQEIFAYPATVTISQILIRPGDNAKDKAETVLSRLQQGEDFGRLAREFSNCETSKNRNGFLGRFRADGTLLPEVQNTAFNMNAGETSKIIFIGDVGYIIIKLETKTDPGYMSIAEATMMIKSKLCEQYWKKKIQEIILKQRAKMKININI